jgi:DNA-dependent protein kinase catalytic subunit
MGSLNPDALRNNASRQVKIPGKIPVDKDVDTKNEENNFLIRPPKTQRFDKRTTHKVIGNAIAKMDIQKRYEKAWKDEIKEQQRHSATIYRKYRSGELPDIQIPMKDIISPMQALYSDPVFSKSLFILLFESIYLESLSDAQKLEINSSLKDLVQGTNYSTNFLSCIFSVCMICEGLNISPKIIGDGALFSNAYHSGILLLEHQLSTRPYSESHAEGSKKHRKLQGTQDIHHGYDISIGSEMARLYRELDENDLMMGLYEKFCMFDYTKFAISAALEGDFVSSLSNYDNALSFLDSSADDSSFNRFEVIYFLSFIVLIDCLDRTLGR